MYATPNEPFPCSAVAASVTSSSSAENASTSGISPVPNSFSSSPDVQISSVPVESESPSVIPAFSASSVSVATFSADESSISVCSCIASTASSPEEKSAPITATPSTAGDTLRSAASKTAICFFFIRLSSF